MRRDRWRVFKIGPMHNGTPRARPWAAIPPDGPDLISSAWARFRRGRMAATQGQAIAYAARQAREDRRRRAAELGLAG